ncbi:MAG: HAMP domain-containing sensor histidine kinase [Bacteroidota bacterium]
MILDSINNRLQTVLISQGKIHLQFKPISAHIIVGQVVRSYQLLALEKNQTILMETKGKAIIWGDELRFSKIIDQLLSNAVKFSPKHSTIKVSIICDTTQVYIAIQDEGPGLSSYDQDLLFRKFIPLTARPTGGESAIGLGLNVAKQLVELHTGNISVYSAGEGKGATFTVSFPLHQAGLQAKSA